MRYDTLLFDADETLLDFLRSEKEAISETLTRFGIEPTADTVTLYSRINKSLWNALERKEIKREVIHTKRFEILCNELGVDYNDTMPTVYINTIATKGYLLPGALEVCKELNKNHRMYIITNGTKAIQEGRFACSELVSLFQKVFISEDIGFNKPSKEFFDAVINDIPDFCIEKTLIIGDSLTSDIAGGICSGIDVCWYNPNGKAVPFDMKINYVISSLDELFDITK